MSFPDANSNAQNTVQANPGSAPAQQSQGSLGGDPFAVQGINPFAQPDAVQQNLQQNAINNGMPESAPMQAPPQAQAPSPTASQVNEVQSPLDKWSPQSDNGNTANQNTNGQQSAPASNNNNNQEAFVNSAYSATMQNYNDALANHNFIQEIKPETMQAVLSGDANALIELINGAVQRGAAASAYMSSQVGKAGLEAQFKEFKDNQLNPLLETHRYNSVWQNSGDGDILHHPTVKPLAESKMRELQAQFPTASPEELKSKTREYFQDFAQVFTASQQPSTEEQQQNSSAQAPDISDLSQFLRV